MSFKKEGASRNELPSISTNCGSAARSSPIIIKQPITFSGNKLVHLPPEVIRIQRNNQPAESGNIMSPSQRVSGNAAFGAVLSSSNSIYGTPPKVTLANLKEGRRSLTATHYQGLLRESPSAESPSEQQNRVVDSPHGSLNHSELDDYIIDEILSLEDDQMALREVGGTKAQPLPASYSCADNLTILSSPHHGSDSRPIPSTTSSGGSGHSGSPIGAIPIGSSSYRQVVSSSAPTSSIDMETLVRSSNQEIVNEPDFYRDRRKKDIHNMIERRRRYNINDRIKELGLMLPKHSAEELKLNKGTILKASCDYIRQLQKDRELMLRQQQQQARLEQTTRIYAERVKELEEQLEKNGLTVPPSSTTLPPVPPAPSSTGRSIKQEPFDEIPPSPSHTPTGSLSSAGFMSQLSDTTAAMAITSPASFQNQHARQHDNSNFFSIGSCSPPDNSPYATPNWRHGHLSSVPSQQQPFPDLIMEDLSSLHTTGPLLQGDPMISAAGGGPSPHGSAHFQSQMSPEIQWDQANFSPENQQNQSTGLTVYQQHSSMDFS